MNMLKHKNQNIDMYMYNTCRYVTFDIHAIYSSIFNPFFATTYKDRVASFLL